MKKVSTGGKKRRDQIQEEIFNIMWQVAELQGKIYRLARERDIIDEELRKSRDGEKPV